MARVVVDVMLKPEILDPQGKAVHGALPRLGFAGIADVRQGKRFELEVEGDVTAELLARIDQLAATLLSNPVIEDYAVSLVEPPSLVEPVETPLVEPTSLVEPISLVEPVEPPSLVEPVETPLVEPTSLVEPVETPLVEPTSLVEPVETSS